MMGIGKSTPLKFKRGKSKKVEIPISPFDDPVKPVTPLARLRKARNLVKRTEKEFPIPVPCPDVVPLNLTVGHKRLSQFFEDSMYSSDKSDSIGRCSTPTDSFCFHCEHYHAEDCCLYINDTDEDKPRYSRFKQNLEHPTCVKQTNFSLLPDAVSGNTTPPHFPTFTPADPNVFEEKMAKQQEQYQMPALLTPQIPLIYFRQFFYPYTSALQMSLNNAASLLQYNHPHKMEQHQIPPQLTSTYHHHQQQVPQVIPQMQLFPTVYHHEYPHFMQQQQQPIRQQQQQSCMTPMTYINAGISFQSQFDLLHHPTLYYQHHQLPMIPTGFY